MAIPRTQKDIQKLAGCLATLRRFIPKLAERCLHFFELLKGARNKKLIDWTPDYHAAFEEVKQHLMNPPILSKAQPREPLHLYITAGAIAVSSALIWEEGGIHSPVYSVSQVLKDAETRYPNLEKFALALVHSSRKLMQYFQGREIKFVPRTAIKAQALAEFVMKCTFPEVPDVPTNQSRGEKEINDNNAWTLYVDGSATVERSGAGLILSSTYGFTIQQVITFAFKATNNQAEYEALLSGLRLAKSLGLKKLVIYSDSQIVVKQTHGEYITKDPKLAQYQAMVCDEADYCLQEVYEGICGDHLAAKALAYKVIRQGYYWPTIHTDTVAYVKRCSKCQKFSNVPKQSPSLLGSVLSSVPFVVWGIGIMGPFPRAKGDLRYVLVTIDYMTK
ncbi:uncharacterized protein LOC141679323 [Apium graveolens]|uniref:uncharacterized protein LOC141679323 n=1 Tax=Apium graveolens TaxID=4045 RepID=UPI003D7B9666